MTKVYIIGSLRSERVPEVAAKVRQLGFEVFDDWYAAGPEADDFWQKYEKAKGHNFAEALRGYAATNVFEFDRRHLDAADIVCLVLPAGKSGHLELGYCLGKGKKGYIVYGEEPDRFDVMYKFADGVFATDDELLEELKRFN